MQVAQYWREQRTRYGTATAGLVGTICPEGHKHFPLRLICPECAQAGFELAREKVTLDAIPVEFLGAVARLQWLD